MTADVLFMYWQNTVDGYCDGKEAVCGAVRDFVRANTAWVRRKVARLRGTNPYWHHVGLFYDQFEGIVHGYDDSAATGKGILRDDLYWMNIFGDLEDLEQVFAGRLNVSLPDAVLGSGSCSALIKVLPDNADLYAAHDTWNSYQSMLRVLKKYTFGYHWTDRTKGALVPGQSMSFSSYPGVIYSGDDFNVISSGLAVIETTIGNNNAKLWPLVKPTGQVLEGIRATVANRLASSGMQWAGVFSRRNSGTYNNQWMVVDYKLFTPGEKHLQDNLLWILEQLPGHIHAEDMTSMLRDQGYWPSYNTPYFKDIFNMSGGPAMVAKLGDWFSYDKTPRALIFKRDQGKVTDVDSMTRLMRYNNFEKDPLSRCDGCNPPFSAENAISARCDLNPRNGTYPFAALGHRSHGGTDMKLTTFAMFRQQQFVAIGGPTYDDLPAFQWSQVDFGNDTPHFGHPDVWKFGPVQHDWALP